MNDDETNEEEMIPLERWCELTGVNTAAALALWKREILAVTQKGGHLYVSEAAHARFLMWAEVKGDIRDTYEHQPGRTDFPAA
jgi:hypothetical protein